MRIKKNTTTIVKKKSEKEKQKEKEKVKLKQNKLGETLKCWLRNEKPSEK